MLTTNYPPLESPLEPWNGGLAQNSSISYGDDDLRQAVEREIAQQRRPLLQGVTVQVKDGMVVLSGRVPSFFAKQIAQHAALRARGVQMVRNEIQVG